MPTNRKMHFTALLSLVGDTLIFLSLSLPYLITNYSQGGMFGEPARQWSVSQTTWNYYFAGLLQPNTGIVGLCMVVLALLFLLSLPTLSVLCLVRPPSRGLSATGMTLSTACLIFWFISACNNSSSTAVSFGPGEIHTTLGPGFYLVPIGLVVAAFSMIALHRQVREQLRWQGGRLP